MDSTTGTCAIHNKPLSIKIEANEEQKARIAAGEEIVENEEVSDWRKFIIGYYFTQHEKFAKQPDATTGSTPNPLTDDEFIAASEDDSESFIYQCQRCSYQTIYSYKPVESYKAPTLCLSTDCILNFLSKKKNDEYAEETKLQLENDSDSDGSS